MWLIKRYWTLAPHCQTEWLAYYAGQSTSRALWREEKKIDEERTSMYMECPWGNDNTKLGEKE